MIVDTSAPYTEDLRPQKERIRSVLLDTAGPVSAARLSFETGVTEDEVWGIAVELASDAVPVCFRLADATCIFSPVQEYWIATCAEDLRQTEQLLDRALAAASEEVAGLRAAQQTLEEAV